MVVQYASDLHFEFESNQRQLEQHPLHPVGEVLILAGDIIELKEEQLKLNFFDRISAQFEQVFLIPGNHEFYAGFDIKDTLEEFYYPVRANVTYLNNTKVVYKGVEFVFSTLWSHITELTEDLRQYFTDFYHCTYNGQPLQPETYNIAHERCLNFLKGVFTKKNSRRIVVTHHLPSKQCLTPDFKYHHMNELFVTELSGLVMDSGAKFWVFGHSHHNAAPLKIGDVQLLSNTLGYQQHNEFGRLSDRAVFEV